MRFRKSALTVATAVVAGVICVGLPSTAWADASVQLPLDDFSHLVVDTAHQHIFFTGDGDNLLVTDLFGHPVQRIPAVHGSTGLALSPDGNTLYVALPDADEVDTVDTRSLTRTAEYPTGTGTTPESVAPAGGRIWFSYGGQDGQGGIGSIDTAGDQPVVTLADPDPGPTTGAPRLAADPAVPDRLFAAQTRQSPGEVTEYDVSAADPVEVASRQADGETPSMAVTPDGTDLVTGSGAYDRFTTSDLSPDGGYGTQSQAVAVAVAPDGTVAVGGAGWGAADLYVFAPGSTTDPEHYALPDTLDPDGVAWAPGGGLYVVTGGPGNTPTLHIEPAAGQADSQLILQGPDSALPGQNFTLSGSLDLADPLPDGATVQVTRSDNGDQLPLPDATVGDGGTFSFTDSVPAEGGTRYTVVYDGDATHAPASATADVQIAKARATLTADAPATATVGKDYTVTGRLDSDTPFAPGQTLRVHWADSQGGNYLQPDPVVAADGTFSFTDSRSLPENVTYLITYAGDDTHTPTSAGATVRALAGDKLTLTGPAEATRATAIKLTGTLSSTTAFPAGETVRVTRTDVAKPVKVADVKVTSNGTFSVGDTPQIGGKVTYTASYPGDATHAPSSASFAVQVSRVTPSLSVTNGSASYTYDAKSKVTVHLGTTYNNRKVALYATPYGGTRTLVTSGAVDSHGNLVAYYSVTRATTFTAAFAGDYRYAPATATHAVTVYAKVAESLLGNYTTTKIGSTTYKVYHHTVNPLQGATISPAKKGECVAFTAQEYVGSAWKTVASAGCVKTGADSSAWAQLTGGHPTNVHFRFRAEYLRPATDPANLSTYGSYRYFEFRT